MAAIASLSTSDPSSSELSQMCMNMCIKDNNRNNTGIIAQINFIKNNSRLIENLRIE